MMSRFEAFLLTRVYNLLSIWESVDGISKRAIWLCFFITKTQDEMPQKSKMERIDLIEQKQLVRIAHELLNFI